MKPKCYQDKEIFEKLTIRNSSNVVFIILYFFFLIFTNGSSGVLPANIHNSLRH